MHEVRLSFKTLKGIQNSYIKTLLIILALLVQWIEQ